MPAEIKRVEDGIYLLFLGNQVTEDELTDTTARYIKDAQQQNLTDYVVIMDSILVTNPLGVARMVTKFLDPNTGYYVIVAGSRDGAVLAERLRQKITNAIVEVQPNQRAAITRAKEIIGTADIPAAPVCDVL